MRTHNEYKRTVKRYPEAVAAGDFDVLDEICTDTIVNHTPLDEPTGLAALKEYESAIHEGLPGFDVSYEELIAEGDHVAMRLTIRGTHRGPIMGVPPTYRDVTFGNMIFNRMEEGRIAERWVQPNVYGLLTQIGAIEGPQ